MKYILTLFISLLLIGCTGGIQKTQFGVQSKKVEKKIKKINNIILAYEQKNYYDIEKILNKELEKYKNDNYATILIYNELAQLYSFNILDIEKAILIDQKIVKLKFKKLNQNSQYIIKYTAANNLLLTSKWYKKKFLDISYKGILQKANKRLSINKKLLSAKIISTKLYKESKLIKVLKISNENYKKTYKKTSDRYKAISKIIKREYELYRTTKNIKYITAYKYFEQKELKLKDIFLDEIDFISLSKFFQLAYKKTNNINYAQMALYSVYKPYLNIRDEKHRLVYNSLVNKYINILIDGNYKQKNNKDLLYYISLNKSRMIYEDILRNNNKSTNIKENLTNNDFNKDTGLPKKERIFDKISKATNYLDFYIEGEYILEDNFTKYNNKQTAFVNTRALFVNKKTKKIEKTQQFIGKVIYVSYVKDGEISVHKIGSKDALLLKKYFDNINNNLVMYHNIKKPNSTHLKKLIPFELGDKLTVSTDKFISKYPLDFFTNKNIIKTTNLFTYENIDNKIKDIKILGYFNPTLDLANSEKEISLIQKNFTNIKVFKRENATLNKLKENIDRNILHLSMHGVNDNINPQESMLLLAGSVHNGQLSDKSLTLKAQDMRKYNQLKDNLLVFTAACETGLTKEMKSNTSEIEGILRPLLINNNKNIILTLWKVPDASAKDFVNYFYTFLSKNKQIQKSFLLAKNKLRAKYKNPVDWAPYYLIQN